MLPLCYCDPYDQSQKEIYQPVSTFCYYAILGYSTCYTPVYYHTSFYVAWFIPFVNLPLGITSTGKDAIYFLITNNQIKNICG